MTQTDYDHKKRECWEEFWRNGSGPINRCPETYEALEAAFYASFDRAYTAAEQSMWRSVEEELPKFDKRVLICERVADKQKMFIGRRFQFSNGDWGWSQSTKESVTHWHELPSLPDTNTEKQ